MGVLKKGIALFGILALWELGAGLLGNPHASFSHAAAVLIDQITQRAFLLDVGLSLRRMVIGYCLVILVGITGGLLMGRFNVLHEILNTPIVAAQAMPGMIWVPVAIFFFGFTEAAVIFTIVLGGIGIVLVSTDSGVRTVPPIIVHAGRVMGARGFKLFWHVIVPAAVPKIIDGLRMAWAFGWRALMAGELILSIGGFGRRIHDVVRSQNIAELAGLMVVIGLIGFLVDGMIFNRIERNIRQKWGLA